jgi:hypothetical protein
MSQTSHQQDSLSPAKLAIIHLYIDAAAGDDAGPYRRLFAPVRFWW